MSELLNRGWLDLHLHLHLHLQLQLQLQILLERAAKTEGVGGLHRLLIQKENREKCGLLSCSGAISSLLVSVLLANEWK